MSRHGFTADQAERALQLRAAGLTWREVGIGLAKEEGRPVAYLAGSVCRLGCDEPRLAILLEKPR